MVLTFSMILINLTLFLGEIFFSFDYCQRLVVLTISKIFLNKPESLPGWDFRQGCPLQLQALVGWWSHYRPEHEQWKSWLGFWSNNSNVKKMVFDWSIVIWKYFCKICKKISPHQTLGMLHGSHLPRFLTLTEMKYLYLYVAIHKQYTIVFFTLYAIIKYSLFFCSTRITLRDIMQRNSGKSIIPVPSLSTCDK